MLGNRAPSSLLEQRLAAVGHEFEHGWALDLSRITRALAALGNPQEKCGRVIHVAGTNGKGSTCAFLWSMAEAAGMTAHVFTSPHLMKPNERIRVFGQVVSDDDFIAALDQVAASNVTVTYFEAITAAAFILFAAQPADVVVLETGLGGIHDATNVVPQPAVSVITPIDLDHMQLLGETITKIAGEKAGIIKAGCPVVIARQNDEAAAVINAAASTLQAPIVPASFTVTDNRLHIAGYDLPAPALQGPHQYENAAVAITALLQLNDARVTAQTLAQGLQNVYWPGRLQRIESGALAAPIMKAAGELWVDGAHNPHGGRALAETLRGWRSVNNRPIILILGMLANKDANGFLSPLAGLVDAVITVPVNSSRSSRSADDSAALATAAGLKAETAVDLMDAAKRAAQIGGEPRVMVCGSLYLVGEALELSGYVIR